MNTPVPMETGDRTNDVVLADGWSILRTLQLPEGEVSLVAVHDGYGWKATVDVPSVVGRLEFHGLYPKAALDCAEEFVRKRVAVEGRV